MPYPKPVSDEAAVKLPASGAEANQTLAFFRAAGGRGAEE